MKKSLIILSMLTSACATAPPIEVIPTPSASGGYDSIAKVSPIKTAPSGGGYYLDDGPPADFDWRAVPDAVPQWEPIHIAATKPYVALGKRYIPRKTLTPYRQQGEASWYGRRYHGRLTATGDIYDMRKMTASHPTLPIPSYARVTRLRDGKPTNKSVIVRINDRGPFLSGRILDLSYTAAAKLDLISVGVGDVLIESIIVPRPAHLPTAAVYIQLGAFTQAANATRLVQKIQSLGIAASVRQSNGHYLALAGPYQQETAAEQVRQTLCAAGHCGFLRPLP
ncbi:MAG: septal ring lytic transglycosylase RlpA family protein [Gammaproteobacteria bacterium]